MFGLGIQEVMVLGVVAVLLFGKRLPEVARSLGTSYREFRRTLTDLQSHMDVRDTFYDNSSSYRQSSSYSANSSNTSSATAEDNEPPTAPKFELPAPSSNPDEANSGTS